MRIFSKYFYIISITFLCGCSKTESENYSHSLIIDGNIIFNEHESNVGNSYGEIFFKHNELKIAIKKSCQFSDFLQLELKKTDLKEGIKYISTSEAKIKKIYLPKSYVFCTAEDECKLINDIESEFKQEQYLLELLNFLRVKYGMHQSAIFEEKIYLKSKDGRIANNSYITIIDNEAIKCQKSMFDNLKE